MSGRDEKRATAMRRLRRSGLTLEEIGDRYGVSRQRVQQVIGSTGYIGRRRWHARPPAT